MTQELKDTIRIGQLKEKSVHKSLKMIYKDSGQVEVEVLGYIVDVLKENTIYEIQTKNFYNIKEKIINICKEHPVVLVHPIAIEKYIVTVDENGNEISRRKSPKKGNRLNIFDELVSAPEFIKEKNLTIQVLLIKKDEYRIKDGKGSWRRKGVSLLDNDLVEIVNVIEFKSIEDYIEIIPSYLYEFTNKELSKELNISINLARKITYTLRKVNVLDGSTKRGREILYKINKN